MPKKSTKAAAAEGGNSGWKDVTGKQLKNEDWIGVDEYDALEFDGNRFQCGDKVCA